MTGMSKDGINLALVKFSGVYPEVKIELLHSAVEDFSPDFSAMLRSVNTVEDVATTHFKYSDYCAESILRFLSAKNINPSSVDAIGMHGQTVFHRVAMDSTVTLQLGYPSVLAEKTKITTIGNFRVRDIAAGGLGAPLVPYLDFVLGKNSKEKCIAYNNLGSISNTTIVQDSLEKTYAFDTGPANMPIDFAMRFSKLKDGFDLDGKYSSRGKPIESLVREMLDIPFLKTPPPRAAGYQEFGANQLTKWFMQYQKKHSAEDLVRSALEFSVRSITQTYKDFIIKRSPDLKKIVFSGGGTKNPFLMQRLREELSEISLEATVMPAQWSDAKEAIAFALLANETLNGRPSNVPSATGARHVCVLGEISYG